MLHYVFLISQKVFDGCEQINALKSGYANRNFSEGNFLKKNISFLFFKPQK